MALFIVQLPTPAQASSLTVPDDMATIQAALDAGADTVLVRGGFHDETPTATNGVVLLGVSGERPSVSGFSYLADNSDSRALFVRGLQIDNQVRIASTGGGASITFEDCDFKAGIFDFSSDPTVSVMTLRRCRIVGTARLQPEGELVVDSCVVVGAVVALHDGLRLSVSRSEFHGGGSGGHGISTSYAHLGDVSIVGCTFEGFGGWTGVAVESDRAITIEDNVVRDCGNGIYAAGGEVRLVRNRIERVIERGILALAAARLDIVDNTVAWSGGTGIHAGCDAASLFAGNLVHHGGSAGFRIFGRGLSGGMRIRNNTSADNAGSGFVLESDPTQGPLELAGNLGVGNGAYGVEWTSPQTSAVYSNNWFDNSFGDSNGQPSSIDDLFTDPLFCDPANGDFHLASISPLVDVSGWGRVGALGIGCAAPGVRENAFRLSRVGPSPSAGPVSIEFEMPRDASVDIEVFDVLGRRVATPAHGPRPAGRHSVVWAPSSSGAGVYLVRFRFPGGEERRRVVRIP